MNKTLKTFLKFVFAYLMFDAFILGYAGFLPGVSVAAAQANLTQTTLAGQVTAGPAALYSGLGQAGGAAGSYQTFVNLASATGVLQAVNGQPVTFLYVDQELMGVLTLVTGQTTIFNVLRGQMGTKPSFHQSGQVVYVQTVSPQFGGFSGAGGLELTDPPFNGQCAAASTNGQPWINVVTGTQFICSAQTQNGSSAAGNTWQPVSQYTNQYQNAPLTQFLTATYTNATTTFSNVPGLAFQVLANRSYRGECRMTWQGSAATTGPKYQFTGPASATAITVGLTSPITSATNANASAVAFSSAVANAGTITTATNFTDVITFSVINGANAGAIQLQAAANGAGTLTEQPGSFCTIQ